MPHDQEVRRLVLLIMISSPVPTWSASSLTKVLRIRSASVRAALGSLLDEGWLRRVEKNGRLFRIFRSSRYRVTHQGFSDGLVELVKHRSLSRNFDNAPRLSSDSLTGFLPVTDDTDILDVISSEQLRTVHAPPMFALCRVHDGGSTEPVAWGMHFTYCVVLTSPSGSPLGRFPDPHGARRSLAQKLGLDKDALYLLWLPPRRSTKA